MSGPYRHALSVLAAVAACMSAAAAATPRYVSATLGSDTGTCVSAAAPCRTIRYTMSQAVGGAPGDTIYVASGTYDRALGEVFPISMKSGVQLVATGTATVRPEGGPASSRIFHCVAGNSWTLIQGFTIAYGASGSTDTATPAVGGAILSTSGDQSRIESNLFLFNVATGATGPPSMPGGEARGGAIYVSGATPVIRNNIFIGNHADGGNSLPPAGGLPAGHGGDAHGGAIYASAGSIANNTFYNNYAQGGTGNVADFPLPEGNGGGADAGAVFSISAEVINNVFAWNHTAFGLAGLGSPGPGSGVALYGALYSFGGVVANNLFFGNYATGQASSGDTIGSAAVLQDPLFHSGVRIGFNSPAVGAGLAAGAPPNDFAAHPRSDPPAIGAFEPWGAYEHAMDLDGEGRSDILWRNASTGWVYRMLMSGFTMRAQGFVYHEPDTAWKIVGDGDFDGNATSDLLWRNQSTGDVYLMLNTPAGTPGDGAIIYSEPDTAWKIVQTPDLDGDGRADLLWWNASTGAVYAMLMDRFAIRMEGFVYSEPNTAWKIAAVLGSAGAQQNVLVWRNDATAQTYLLWVWVSPQGFSLDGAFVPSLASPPASRKIAGAADFDGDGQTDIVWRDESTGQVHIWLVRDLASIDCTGQFCPVPFEEALVYGEPNLAWRIVAVGDYDGDGKGDLLWRNDTTGQVWLMLMDGFAIRAQGPLYTEPDTAWKILGPSEYSAPAPG